VKSRQHAQPDLSVYLIQVFSGCITLDSYDGISSSLLKNEPIHVNTTLTSQQVFKFTLAVLAALALAYIFLISAQILVVLVVAVLIASAVRPLVVKLRRLRLPEGLAILVVYAGIAIAIFVLFALVLPPVINQMANYLQNDWQLVSRLVYAQSWIERRLTELTGGPVSLIPPEEIDTAVTNFLDNLRITAPDMVDDIGAVLGDAVLTFVMGLYWLTSRDSAVDFLTRLFAPKHKERTIAIITEIEDSLGSYMSGIVLVALIVGIANFVLLVIFGVPNAATLSFIIGFTTIIPIVGGLIGGALATILALLTSPLNGLIVFVVFILMQQLENHVLTPRVMSRSVGLDPLLVIVGVFIGFSLGGVVGAIVSIPVMGTLAILIKHLILEPYQQNLQPYRVEDGVIVFSGDATQKPPVDPTVPQQQQ